MDLLQAGKVSTVCSQARCPNFGACLRDNELTFLILGDTCTRHCRFCAVDHARGVMPGVDDREAVRICAMALRLGLQYAVVTSVTRDDLADGGAEHFAAVIRSLSEAIPGIIVEILVPDFLGRRLSIQTVMEAGPKVFGHNIETVPRLYKELRPGADYRRSLEVIAQAKTLYPETFTKSSLMLGLGETRAEVRKCMEELAGCGCDILVLGQYLRPSKAQVPVERFLHPEEFLEYEAAGREAGFKAVSCGPLVRSSYKAKDIYNRLFIQKGSICTIRS